MIPFLIYFQSGITFPLVAFDKISYIFSFEEFMEQTKKAEFEQDAGWKGLDEEELYSQQEYEAYQHQREEEIRKLVESGAVSTTCSFLFYFRFLFSFFFFFFVYCKIYMIGFR